MSSYWDRIQRNFGYAPVEPDPPHETGLLADLRAQITEVSTLNTQQRFWAFGGAVLVTALCWGLVRPKYALQQRSCPDMLVH
jgi:hypothetical protein